jgi:hypothetical protein
MLKHCLPPVSVPVVNWRGLFLVLLALTSLISVCFPLKAEVLIAVVAHPGDSWQANAGKLLLANIYRRKLTINDLAVPYVPVNLPAADPLRRAFTRSLFGQSPEDMQGYWNQQYFHGISPPSCASLH